MADLRCPHCGDKLSVTLETKGSAYLHYEVPESIECEGDCQATWEPDGTARDEPKWIRYPDLYNRPQCPSTSHDTNGGWRCEHRAGHDLKVKHKNGEEEW